MQNAASLALQGPLGHGALAALFALAPGKLDEVYAALDLHAQWSGETPGCVCMGACMGCMRGCMRGCVLQAWWHGWMGGHT